MQKRRFDRQLSFQDKLTLYANEMREKASSLQPGPERDAFLTKARQADTATRLTEWANSPGLQPPE